MYQKLSIIGNLGRDPELRYTPSGQAVCNFSVATSRKWTGGDGQVQEETVWFKVSTWGKQAEICNQYLSKGRQVFVEGRLTIDKETGGPRVWQDNNGNYRASLEVNALEVKFLGGRDSQPQDANSPAPRTPEAGSEAPHFTEDEIPF